VRGVGLQLDARLAAVDENGPVLTVLRILHVLSASVWVGGTVALVFVGVPAIRRLEGEARATAMRALGRRWRPLGWSAMGVAIVSGLWLTELNGGFTRPALDTPFDRTLIAKSALVVVLCVGAVLHDYVLGPRLQRELHAADPRAPETRRRLVVVGWVNFTLTIVVPVLGAIALTELT
jgi:putative copper export protein